MSQAEIGAEPGVSQVQVSGLLSQILGVGESALRWEDDCPPSTGAVLT